MHEGAHNVVTVLGRKTARVAHYIAHTTRSSKPEMTITCVIAGCSSYLLKGHNSVCFLLERLCTVPQNSTQKIQRLNKSFISTK